ncbi:hypothetical protein [Acinetobacter seifertii]|uniref:hypothetical protein n=1 Tax=Acinetobacter seifertii TaxID=1530123 RepID=UPI0019073DFA|nr:hypothetical protein [Acinetobacter seifertii]MBJ9425169.1 hypothetical protein [Acinetobacter seifertii]
MQKFIDVIEKSTKELNHFSPAPLGNLRAKGKAVLQLILEVEKSVRKLVTTIFAIRFFQILTSFTIITALFYAFLIFGGDAQEIENEGRYQANQKYTQLVEVKNPDGIYISK